MLVWRCHAAAYSGMVCCFFHYLCSSLGGYQPTCFVADSNRPSSVADRQHTRRVSLPFRCQLYLFCIHFVYLVSSMFILHLFLVPNLAFVAFASILLVGPKPYRTCMFFAFSWHWLSCSSYCSWDYPVSRFLYPACRFPRALTGQRWLRTPWTNSTWKSLVDLGPQLERYGAWVSWDTVRGRKTSTWSSMRSRMV